MIKLNGADKRPRKYSWVGIVIHHTGVGDRKDISESMWKKLSKNISLYLAKKDNAFVSAHYSIGRQGTVYQIIDPDKFVAFHAGKSSFWHPLKRKIISGCNNYYIGIELIGDGNKFSYSDEQYEACSSLIKLLMSKYTNILPNLIVGHEMISPKRKVDPGKRFHWKKLFKLIYKLD